MSKAQIIGYTAGVFDMFHIGHLNILRSAKSQCDFLVVGVTTDELATSTKNKKPIIPFEERNEIVQSIKYVDQVVPQENLDRHAKWQAIGFNRMFVGDDWKNTERWLRYESEFSKVGVDIVYLPYTKHTSSTLLRSVLEKINL